MDASLTNPDDYDAVMAVLNVAVIIAFCTGFLPPAVYAYAAELWKRYVWLSIHVNWITFAWSLITNIISVCMPYQIASIFGKGDSYFEWSKKELITTNWGTFLMFGRFTFQSMLQSQQNGKRAMAVSFLSNLVAIIASLYIIDAEYPHQTEKLLWCFSLGSVVGLVVGIVILAVPFYRVVKAWKYPSLDDENKENENNNEANENNNETNGEEEKKDSSSNTNSTNNENDQEEEENIPNNEEQKELASL